MRSSEQELAIELKDIYSGIIFDGTIVDDGSELKKLIIDIVDENNKLTKKLFDENPESSFLFDGSAQLIKAFLGKFSSLINDGVDIARRVSFSSDNTIDITTTVLPFVITRLGIANNEVGIFLSLALCMTKIILSKSERNHKKSNEKKLTTQELSNMINKFEELYSNLEDSEKEAITNARRSN